MLPEKPTRRMYIADSGGHPPKVLSTLRLSTCAFFSCNLRFPLREFGLKYRGLGVQGIATALDPMSLFHVREAPMTAFLRFLEWLRRFFLQSPSVTNVNITNVVRAPHREGGPDSDLADPKRQNAAEKRRPVRSARQSRPQLLCILADESSSMGDPPEKARAASEGIRQLIRYCQAQRPGSSYYKILMIRFHESASVDPKCDMKPVAEIDPDSITIQGHGDSTNITDALALALKKLGPYTNDLQSHADRDEHPLPLVLLFSDGEHNEGELPQRVAQEIKRLGLDGETVVVAVAGVSVGTSRPDEGTLREIASPGCYLHVNDPDVLAQFIAEVGSSGGKADKVRQIVENMNRR